MIYVRVAGELWDDSVMLKISKDKVDVIAPPDHEQAGDFLRLVQTANRQWDKQFAAAARIRKNDVSPIIGYTFDVPVRPPGDVQNLKDPLARSVVVNLRKLVVEHAVELQTEEHKQLVLPAGVTSEMIAELQRVHSAALDEAKADGKGDAVPYISTQINQLKMKGDSGTIWHRGHKLKTTTVHRLSTSTFLESISIPKGNRSALVEFPEHSASFQTLKQILKQMGNRNGTSLRAAFGMNGLTHESMVKEMNHLGLDRREWVLHGTKSKALEKIAEWGDIRRETGVQQLYGRGFYGSVLFNEAWGYANRETATTGYMVLAMMAAKKVNTDSSKMTSSHFEGPNGEEITQHDSIRVSHKGVVIPMVLLVLER